MPTDLKNLPDCSAHDLNYYWDEEKIAATVRQAYGSGTCIHPSILYYMYGYASTMTRRGSLENVDDVEAEVEATVCKAAGSK